MATIQGAIDAAYKRGEANPRDSKWFGVVSDLEMAQRGLGVLGPSQHSFFPDPTESLEHEEVAVHLKEHREKTRREEFDYGAAQARY